MTQKAKIVEKDNAFYNKTIAMLHVINNINNQRSTGIYLTEEGKRITNQLKIDDPHIFGQFSLFLKNNSASNDLDETVENEAIAWLRVSPDAHLLIEKIPDLPIGEYSLTASHFFPTGTRPSQMNRISSIVNRLKK